MADFGDTATTYPDNLMPDIAFADGYTFTTPAPRDFTVRPDGGEGISLDEGVIIGLGDNYQFHAPSSWDFTNRPSGAQGYSIKLSIDSTPVLVNFKIRRNNEWIDVG